MVIQKVKHNHNKDNPTHNSKSTKQNHNKDNPSRNLIFSFLNVLLILVVDIWAFFNSCDNLSLSISKHNLLHGVTNNDVFWSWFVDPQKLSYKSKEYIYIYIYIYI